MEKRTREWRERKKIYLILIIMVGVKLGISEMFVLLFATAPLSTLVMFLKQHIALTAVVKYIVCSFEPRDEVHEKCNLSRGC